MLYLFILISYREYFNSYQEFYFKKKIEKAKLAGLHALKLGSFWS